ncbi:hypothetical protein ACFVHS_10675 [Streptomyces sp. NPDC057746]|uniref:hypothetical protein n=1 Tax=Streptomyces sp. NPDC057746 TaxID=3346237 RepID=UPI0036C4C208
MSLTLSHLISSALVRSNGKSHCSPHASTAYTTPRRPRLLRRRGNRGSGGRISGIGFEFTAAWYNSSR